MLGGGETPPSGIDMKISDFHPRSLGRQNGAWCDSISLVDNPCGGVRLSPALTLMANCGFIPRVHNVKNLDRDMGQEAKGRMGVRVAIDTGGTFTDAAAIDEDTNEILVAKSPTTPEDYLEGVVRCIQKSALDPSDTSLLVHGTTVVTNSIIQRILPKSALITTKGFRDVLEMTRANRPTWGLYDIMWDKPKPLIPRFLRFEIDERTDYHGNIVRPFPGDEAAALVRRLKGLGIETIAVSFLFAHRNPANEEKMRELIRWEFPEAFVSISSEINSQVREYERTSTVVINAVVKPLAYRYFNHLEDGLGRYGFESALMIMRSNGGLMSARAASESPVSTIESGPAGGTIGSVFVGEAIGQQNLIAVDMGGTTFKVSLVDDGEPREKTEGEVEWGVPFRVPMLDITEIGAGGGSIAQIDVDGTLKVGPESAGAEPGPVCYQRGGTEPTITDAQLVLGRLNPRYLLGGEMKIDIDAAREAISDKVAKPLGLDVVEAARGIVEISNARMLGSMRVSSVERGYDPRDFWVIGYGGMGPMVASVLAQELGSPKVVIPPHPGIFSAFGMLVTDVKLDFLRSFRSPVDEGDVDTVNRIYHEMETEALASLRRDFAGNSRLIRTADLRYVGQNYDVNRPMPSGPLTHDSLKQAGDLFEAEHMRLYGHAKSGEPIELVALRVSVVGVIDRPKLQRIAAHHDAAGAIIDQRPVFFDSAGDFVTCPVYNRPLLGAGCELPGPATIEAADSTTVVYPGQHAEVDPYGNLIIEVGGR